MRTRAVNRCVNIRTPGGRGGGYNTHYPLPHINLLPNNSSFNLKWFILFWNRLSLRFLSKYMTPSVCKNWTQIDLCFKNIVWTLYVFFIFLYLPDFCKIRNPKTKIIDGHVKFTFLKLYLNFQHNEIIVRIWDSSRHGNTTV